AIVGVALGAPAALQASTLACLTGTAGDIALDRQQLVDLRTAIDAACACPLFDGQPGRKHADYVRCGKQVVRDGFRGGALRQACVRTVNGYVKDSSCGTDPLLAERPCIRVRSGGGNVSCSIKSAARNESRGSDARPATACNRPHADWTSCADAADTNHDGLIGAGDSGACACHPGFADCDQQVDDGCEVDLQSDVSNCGACGRACSAPSGGSVSCVDGACVGACPDGEPLCGTDESGGGECVPCAPPPDQCHQVADTCNADGSCSYSAVADSTPCSDGGNLCVGGECVQVPPLAALSVSPLTLRPAFSPSTHDYAVVCSTGTNSLTLRMTAVSAAAQSLGAHVASA